MFDYSSVYKFLQNFCMGALLKLQLYCIVRSIYLSISMACSKLLMIADLGDDREISINDTLEVYIMDKVTKNCAYFTAPRWSRFVCMIEDIDVHVRQASWGKSTAYQKHIGCKWYVSVGDNYPTVDIRRWYVNVKKGNRIMPTRVGIALTYRQWDKVKEAVRKVEQQVPALVAISPCWHDSQDQMMRCTECSPFYGLEVVEPDASR